MEPRHFLRVEGATAAGLALLAYWVIDGPIWLLVVLAFAPDLSMIAYLFGARVGSLGYNLVHTYTGPVALGAGALWTETRLVLLVALIWVAHIGADRLVGYGLKYASGFEDTHLSHQPAPMAALRPADES